MSVILKKMNISSISFAESKEPSVCKCIFLRTALFEIMKNIRQRQTSHRWKYNTTHAFFVLGTKVYKHTLRIFNIYCFSTGTIVRRKKLKFMFTGLLSIHLICLIKTWTKSPLPISRVKRWSNSLPTTTCSGEHFSSIWIS